MSKMIDSVVFITSFTMFGFEVQNTEYCSCRYFRKSSILWGSLSQLQLSSRYQQQYVTFWRRLIVRFIYLGVLVLPDTSCFIYDLTSCYEALCYMQSPLKDLNSKPGWLTTHRSNWNYDFGLYYLRWKGHHVLGR
jgi:hypothetical protein